MFRPYRFTVALAAALTIASASDAKAYMDPGSGSFVIQMIIAGVVGLGVTLKIYWQKLKGYFGVNANSEDESNDDG